MRLLITFALAIVFASAQTPANTSGTIEGTVTRFGTADPIANVTISLQPGPEPYWYPEAVTDSNGHFILRDVTPGTYNVRAVRGGYVNPAPDGVGIKDGGETKKVTVSAGQRIEDANLTLARAAVIAGRILDISGRPAVDAEIILSRQTGDGRPIRYALTNDRGEYRTIGLEVGRYSVAARAFNDWTNTQTTVLTYFPGKTAEADAVLVDVEEGAVVDGIDFSLQPAQRVMTFKVSGKLISGNSVFSGKRLSDLYLVPKPLGKPKAMPTHSNGGLFATAQTNRVFTGDASSFDFAFNDVREGRYDLFIETGSRTDEDCCDVVGRALIDVHADLTGLTVVAGGIDVRGRIVLREGASGKPSGSVSLALVPEDIRTRQVKFATSGAFTIPAVVPGAWKVLVTGLPPEFTLFDVLQMDETVVDSGLAVTDRSAEPFEVILTAAGSVEGTIRDAGGTAIVGADLVLIPVGGNETRTALYRRTSSDGAGRFSVTSVAVGDYAAVAFRRGSLPSGVASGASLKTFVTPYQPQFVVISVLPGASTVLTLTPAHQPDDRR